MGPYGSPEPGRLCRQRLDESEDEGAQNYSGIVAGGGGFRDLAARRLGLHTDLNVAVGPEDTVIYIAVGGDNW